MDDLLAREPRRLEPLEVLHEVPHREVGGVAQAVVPELAPEQAGREIGLRQRLGAIPAGLKRRLNQAPWLRVRPPKKSSRDPVRQV